MIDKNPYVLDVHDGEDQPFEILALLGAVQAAGLLAALHAERVEGAAQRCGTARPADRGHRPPRTSTIECSCRLCPSPGM